MTQPPARLATAGEALLRMSGSQDNIPVSALLLAFMTYTALNEPDIVAAIMQVMAMAFVFQAVAQFVSGRSPGTAWPLRRGQ